MLIRTLARLFGRHRDERDLDEELRSHLALDERERIQTGETPSSARHSARREFGNLAMVRETTRETWGWVAVEQFFTDVQSGVRLLVRYPSFSLFAIVSLALGIGAVTAIFSVADETLLRPLPVPDPSRLVNVYTFHARGARYLSSSFGDYSDIQETSTTIEALSAYVRFPLNVTISGQTERTPVEGVTGNYFSMLGLRPVAGRNFTMTDDAPNAPPVAMIGEALWSRRFGASGSAIGETIRIDGHPFTVAGVVPGSYTGANLNWNDPPQVWIPLRATTIPVPQLGALFTRRLPWLVMMGRLVPDATVESAGLELQSIASRIADAEPGSNADLTFRVFWAAQSKFWPAYRDTVMRAILVFAIAAALVLLLACGNVANLLLERASLRRREFAIRLSLGAPRNRLVRQLVTESLVLAIPGLLLALVVVRGLQAILLQFPGALGLPLSLDLTVDFRVLLFSGGVALVTVVLFGLAPTRQMTRPAVLPELAESGKAVTAREGGWSRRSLVVLQITASMMLLVGAGLFGRALWNSYAVDLGIRNDRLLSVSFSVPLSGAEAERFSQDRTMFLDRMESLPGVASAALSGEPLLGALRTTVSVSTGSEGASVQASPNSVTPDYFRTTGIAIERGREFAPTDSASGIPVAVINQTLARRLWSGQDPVGRGILVAGAERQVIGVAHDARYSGVWDDGQPYIYLPMAQSTPRETHLLIQTLGPPELLIPSVRALWHEVSADIPMYDMQTGEEIAREVLAPERVRAGLLAAFGLTAILLAAAGLYGTMSHAVARRTREIGIRLAIGARPANVLRQVLIRSLLLATAGIVIGGGASSVLSGYLVTYLHGVSPRDPSVFAAAAAAVIVVCLAAGFAPARRASRIDPWKSLRFEG